eukprot:TRINITY_DN11064_c0_g1_i1.p1 TRINITY_DN11064_c0_g1~~TRINITY_DN11064_c0_g1_i1.p1  ORF type:complete len:113 (-),score=11.85 TRINITY_DN11064_c0_g1_i1:155-493(-)
MALDHRVWLSVKQYSIQFEYCSRNNVYLHCCAFWSMKGRKLNPLLPPKNFPQICGGKHRGTQEVETHFNRERFLPHQTIENGKGKRMESSVSSYAVTEINMKRKPWRTNMTF